jgi:hypothetical protein
MTIYVRHAAGDRSKAYQKIAPAVHPSRPAALAPRLGPVKTALAAQDASIRHVSRPCVGVEIDRRNLRIGMRSSS